MYLHLFFDEKLKYGFIIPPKKHTKFTLTRFNGILFASNLTLNKPHCPLNGFLPRSDMAGEASSMDTVHTFADIQFVLYTGAVKFLMQCNGFRQKPILIRANNKCRRKFFIGVIGGR